MISHGRMVALLQFFTDKIEDYWHILYPLTDPKKREADPYLYYYDISRKAIDFRGKFSEEGIYLFEGYDGQWHLHALEIAQYALACWLAWRNSGEQHWLEKAMRHSQWLSVHQESDGAWRIAHKNPIYRELPTPWASALAQALAISALVRAYRYTEEAGYLDAARKAADFLEVPVEAGGVKRVWDEGYIYEEYPLPQRNGVLNGYISTLFALEELATIVPAYRVSANANMENLLRILPLYDAGYWSYYALNGTLSSGFYHRYLCRQLEALAQDDARFVPWRRRFEGYTKCFACRMKALARKIKGRK